MPGSDAWAIFYQNVTYFININCIKVQDIITSVNFLFVHGLLIWNSLPDSVVDVDTLNTFKSRLDKHRLDQDVLYNFHSELTGTIAALICM